MMTEIEEGIHSSAVKNKQCKDENDTPATLTHTTVKFGRFLPGKPCLFFVIKGLLSFHQNYLYNYKGQLRATPKHLQR